MQKRSEFRQQVLERECLENLRQCGRRRSGCPRAAPRWTAAGFCLSLSPATHGVLSQKSTAARGSSGRSWYGMGSPLSSHTIDPPTIAAM